MSYLQAVEALLQDAVAAGHFSGLPGEGRPLPFRPEEGLAGDDWIGFKVLQNGGMLPDFLDTGRQVEALEARLADIDRQHATCVASAADIETWTVVWPLLLQLRARYETAAHVLRRAQEQFNWEAPGQLSQRPPIWIEYRLERLDMRLSSPLTTHTGTR